MLEIKIWGDPSPVWLIDPRSGVGICRRWIAVSGTDFFSRHAVEGVRVLVRVIEERVRGAVIAVRRRLATKIPELLVDP